MQLLRRHDVGQELIYFRPFISKLMTMPAQSLRLFNCTNWNYCWILLL